MLPKKSFEIKSGKIHIKEIRNYVFIVLSMVMYIFAYLKYSTSHDLKIFNRKIGVAAATNYDINIVLKRFYLSYLFAFPLLILLVVVIVEIYKKKILLKKNSEDLLKVINKYAFFLFVCLTCECVTKFDTTQKVASICKLGFVLLLCMLLYPIIRKKRMIDSNDLKWIVIVNFNISFFFSLLGVNYILAFGIGFLLICFLLNAVTDNKIKSIGTPMAFYLWISTVLLEAIVVLNQHQVVVSNLKMIFGVAFLALLLIGIVKFKLLTNLREYDSIMDVGVLLGMVGMAALPKIQTTVATDLFEQANSAVSINQLVEFGKIPFVETISAHLASDWLPGTLYYLINRDLEGAFFSPYTLLFDVAWILVFYYILKESIGAEDALIICLLVPFFSFSSGWQQMGIMSVAALVFLLKKDMSVKRAISFWCVLLVSVLYKADAGLAFGLAAIVSYIVIKILNREKVNWKRFVLSGGAVALVAGVAFCLICNIKEIDILKRIKEFLEIFATSNEVWSYGEFGTAGTLQYTIVYFFIPIMVILALLVYGFKIWKSKSYNKIVDAVILSMGIAYLFNLQRIIVRHNLREGGYSVSLTFTAGVFFAMFMMEIVHREREKIFVFVFLAFGCFFSIEKANVLSIENIEAVSKYNLSLTSLAFEKIYNNTFMQEYNLSSKVKRVQIDQEMQNQYVYVVREIQELLKDDETFLDFSNQSLIYALAHKKLPVYVVQSPGQISGEFGQSMFLDEIKEQDCPIAISVGEGNLSCGIGVDGIQHSYRQYQISEYLNDNYIPLEMAGDFVIWVRNDRTDIMEKIHKKFIDFDINGLWNDCVINKKESQISMVSIGEDPFVADIEIPNIESDEFSISMRYTSDSLKQVQVFYTDDAKKGYSEERSIVLNVQKEGIIHVNLKSAQARYIRIDIEPNSKLEIQKAWISDGNYSLCDYSYGDYSAIHVYNLGSIPYLWGNLDENESYKNEKIMNCVENDGKYDIIPDIMAKENSVYLEVVIDSTEESMAILSLGVFSEESYNERMRYSIKLYAGECRYLIRVSADSNWKRGDINSMYIDETQNVIVKSASFIKGN